MYGLVNRAVEDLVVGKLGSQGWTAVRERAGVGSACLLSMESYPDEMTYRLVGAASETMGTTANEFLELLGEHWIRFTANQGYSSLLDMGFREVLAGLNRLHANLGLVLPELRPPSFTIRELERGLLLLEYRSQREGLAPMVVGLLKGLGARAGVSVDVRHTVRKGVDADHDEFLVRTDPPV